MVETIRPYYHQINVLEEYLIRLQNTDSMDDRAKYETMAKIQFAMNIVDDFCKRFEISKAEIDPPMVG